MKKKKKGKVKFLKDNLKFRVKFSVDVLSIEFF